MDDPRPGEWGELEEQAEEAGERWPVPMREDDDEEEDEDE